MQILIADDEAPARQRLRALIAEIGAPYTVAGEAGNGGEVLQLCRDSGVDLVLMDIRMPGMDGIQAATGLAEMATPPAVIFVTAFEEHALEAFKSNAVDYLLKPIRRRKLEQALSRVDALTRPQLRALRNRLETAPPYLTVNYRGGTRRIDIDQVFYLLADQKYVTVRHRQGEVLLEESLKSLEERFGSHFIRVHRNALVACHCLRGVERLADGRCLTRIDGCSRQLEISRRHLPEVRRWLKAGDG